MNMHITPDGTVAPTAARSSLPQPLALQHRPADAPPLTRVSLAYVHERFNLYLRFGQPERTVQLDHWRRCAVFKPQAVFCRVRWQANDHGTTLWQLMVLQAGNPLDTLQRLPGVRPGARMAAKGLADELHDKGYLVIDGIDGKAHYLALPSRTELDQFPIGGVLEARSGVEPTAGPRPADCNIAALAVQGLYRTDLHLALARSQLKPGRNPQETVVTHVRRLEALRRAGIVERVSEGVWYVPADLPARGEQFDVQRSKGIEVVLHSHLTIEQQTHAIGATWLDQQLVGGVTGLGNLGFANDLKLALQHRTEFLVELGLAKHQQGQLVLASDLLGSLRNRELEQAAQEIAAETHLTYRLPNAEQRVAGIYRRSIQLASGRYAVLDDGQSFSLVPWRPELEVRLGQKVAALVRGSSVSYELHRTRNLNL